LLLQDASQLWAAPEVSDFAEISGCQRTSLARYVKEHDSAPKLSGGALLSLSNTPCDLQPRLEE
jgi:hypothetical protein